MKAARTAQEAARPGRGGFPAAGACLAALLLILPLLAGCGGKKKEQAPQSVKVRTSKPVRMLFQEKLRVEGSIEPEEYADICARVDGVIDGLMVDEGSMVAKGAMLFQSDKVNLQNKVEIAKQNKRVSETQLAKIKIDLDIVKLQCDKSITDFDRAKKLVESKVISDDSYEQAELRFKKAKADILSAESSLEHANVLVNQAASNLRIAEKELEDSIITSPIGGVVVRTFKKPGEYAKKGETVLRIENPEKLKISILLSSNCYPRIKVKETKAAVYDMSGEKLADAAVSYKSPSINPSNRTFEIEISLPCSDRMVSGMLCTIDLILLEREGVGVPRESVIATSGSKPVIYSVEGGKARPFQVERGISDGGFVEIRNLEDLSMDVVTGGQAFLSEGTAVSVMPKTE